MTTAFKNQQQSRTPEAPSPQSRPQPERIREGGETSGGGRIEKGETSGGGRRPDVPPPPPPRRE